MTLTLGVFTAVIVEDVLEVVYDETDTLPYEAASGVANDTLTPPAECRQASWAANSLSTMSSLTQWSGRLIEPADRPAHPSPAPIISLDSSLRC